MLSSTTFFNQESARIESGELTSDRANPNAKSASSPDFSPPKNKLDSSLLAFNILYDDIEDLRGFLVNGANPNSQDRDTKFTLLYKFTTRSYPKGFDLTKLREAINLLIQYGAEVNIIWPYKQDKIEENEPDHYFTPFINAIKNYSDAGCTEIASILMENKADLKAKDALDGRTPLHIAANIGAARLVKVLIDKGADVNARDKKGRKPSNLCSTSTSPKLKTALTSKSKQAAEWEAAYNEEDKKIEKLNEIKTKSDRAYSNRFS